MIGTTLALGGVMNFLDGSLHLMKRSPTYVQLNTFGKIFVMTQK